MELRRINDFLYEIPQTGAMRVPGRVYISADMLSGLEKEQSLLQVANVATLPGIVEASLAMPDIHWGYGFPIGGVAAFDWDEGVISPGGVGYDINCGVRLATTLLSLADIAPRLEALAGALFSNTPSGVGSTGFFRLTSSEEKKVLARGSSWALDQGFGEEGDVECTEDSGCMPDADPDAVSKKALDRGHQQLGTLGSGNHFLELGVVDEIFDPATAAVFGLREGQVTLLLHSGSRGLGYQICDDFLSVMQRASAKLGIALADRQLACAPIESSEGRQYRAAMACAANYAWANRQILMHQAHDTLLRSLSISPRDLGMRLLYDVCHNIAKKEEHVVEGKKRVLCVHRKGATRAFCAGHPAVPQKYRKVGQPVLVPGDMGRCSYILAGSDKAMEQTFGSSCHGAGRVMSRTAARKSCRSRNISSELAARGILVRWTGHGTLEEEIPEAYKDVTGVVGVVHGAGLARKVARTRPVIVVKG